MCMHLRSDNRYICMHSKQCNAKHGRCMLQNLFMSSSWSSISFCWMKKISADILFYTTVADVGFWKGGVPVCTWLLYLAKRSQESMWSVPTREVWGHATSTPLRKFLISDFLRSFLVLFWGKIARARRPTANLVIVFEVFKHSQNLNA